MRVIEVKGRRDASPDEMVIFRAAKLIVGQHGAAADFYAADRADKLLGEGDIEGARIWRRILKAILTLGRARRPEDVLH